MRQPLEATDRYDALGIIPPPPAECCAGQCEGTGWIPVQAQDADERLRTLWRDAETACPASDGWHFVKCPDCGGTGRKKGTPAGSHAAQQAVIDAADMVAYGSILNADRDMAALALAKEEKA